MKRQEFIKELTAAGCYLKRHGANHDIYVNQKNGRKAPVPRHSEIKDSFCILIISIDYRLVDKFLIPYRPPTYPLFINTLSFAKSVNSNSLQIQNFIFTLIIRYNFYKLINTIGKKL